MIEVGGFEFYLAAYLVCGEIKGHQCEFSLWGLSFIWLQI